MTEGEILNRRRMRPSAERPPTPAEYTAKDFQLEVLERLAEMQAMAEGLQEWCRVQFTTIKEQASIARFDPRTLVAIGAIALSITGYVLQDARNTSRRDAEVETIKMRVTSLERIAEVNTEGRVRMDVELKELHEGQEEIKRLLAQHESRTQSLQKKNSSGGNGTWQ